MYLMIAVLMLFASGLRAQSPDSAADAGARITAPADEYVREYLRTFPAAAELAGPAYAASPAASARPSV